MGDERESDPNVSIDFDPDEAISEAIRSIGEEMTKAAKELDVTKNSLEESLSEVDKTAEEIIKELEEEEEEYMTPVNEGDYVIVKMTGGYKTGAQIIHHPDATTASSYSLPSGESLKQYWGMKDFDIAADEDVYEVELLDGGDRYAFPESKVWLHVESLPISLSGEEMDALEDAGLTTAQDIHQAPKSEVEEATNSMLASDLKDAVKDIRSSPVRSGVQECPACECQFSPSDPSVVEGDEGELYCSISCLNESYS